MIFSFNQKYSDLNGGFTLFATASAEIDRFFAGICQAATHLANARQRTDRVGRSA